MNARVFSVRALVIGALLCAACEPTFDDALSRVTTTKLLAVQSTPTEATPNAAVSWRALVAGPDGTVENAPALAWSLCLQPKPVVEANVVAAACLADAPSIFANDSTTASTTIPSNVCQLFGPDLPPQQPGQPDTRPRVPDATGGYYQPVRVDLDGRSTIALTRVRCNLLGASLPIATEFRARYVANRDPKIARVAFPDVIRVGEHATITVEWTADSAEPYVVFDLLEQRIRDVRESLHVSWYATAGTWESDRTGVAPDDLTTRNANTWRAPSTPGVVHVWIVVRDDRGGVDWIATDIAIAP